LLIVRVGSTHTRSDHAQAKKVLGDCVVDLTCDPGPLRGTGFGGGAFPLGSQRRADLAGHHADVRLESAELVPSRGGQMKGGVVAVSSRDGCSLESVDSSHERTGNKDPEQHANGHYGEQQGEE
jgi:hypothetical protein